MKIKLNEQMIKFDYLIGEFDKLYHDAAVKFGLTDSALAVVYTICAEGSPCPISEICRFTGVSKQTANSALRKLESGGVIYLEAVDGKQKAAALTARGEELAEATAVRLIEAENRVFGSWTEEERSEFLRLNLKLYEQLKTEFEQLGVRA